MKKATKRQKTGNIPDEIFGIDEYAYYKKIETITEKKKAFADFTKEIRKEIDPKRAIQEETKKLLKDIAGSEVDTP